MSIGKVNPFDMPSQDDIENSVAAKIANWLVKETDTPDSHFTGLHDVMKKYSKKIIDKEWMTDVKK